MGVLKDLGVDAYVECGPGKVLAGLLKRIGRTWPKPPALHNVEDGEGAEKARAVLFGLL
jgi:malonyl CoA-acyl carrier protein transacylase